MEQNGQEKNPVSLQKMKQMPLALEIPDKRDVRTQFGALCYRVMDGKTEILMITSRGTGRWIIPKGWPMEGKTPGDSALREAWEEAGVKGKVTGGCLALYSYMKRLSDEDPLPCAVMVYPVKVKTLLEKYPEKGQRRRKWMSPKKAAQKVDEAELAHLLRTFDAT